MTKSKNNTLKIQKKTLFYKKPHKSNFAVISQLFPGYVVSDHFAKIEQGRPHLVAHN